jgi:hypothetical protein
MIQLEQAVYHRSDTGPALLRGKSPGFSEDWCGEAAQIAVDFGARPAGVSCPLTVFALPLGSRHVAVVRVAERAGHAAQLAFHFLTVERRVYEHSLGDPFQLSEHVPPLWEADAALPPLTLPGPLPTPTVAQVREVLRRVKASALREGEDPDTPSLERTVANSESPALLGGAQVLVDGGRLVFRRPQGDLRLIAGLWSLLPVGTRARRWPASFAFGNALGFDVLAVARVDADEYEGYLTEDQAADYPQGRYELALQLAAEAGSQAELTAVLSRHDSGEVLRRTLLLLAAMIAIVLGGRALAPLVVPPTAADTEQRAQAAVAAAMAAGADPLGALGLYYYGKSRWGRR